MALRIRVQVVREERAALMVVAGAVEQGERPLVEQAASAVMEPAMCGVGK